MFVVHALVLTFITTPLTIAFYPARLRVHHRGDKKPVGDEAHLPQRTGGEDDPKTRFSIIFDKMEQLPAAMTISQLFSKPQTFSVSDKSEEAGDMQASTPSISIEALRLVELSERTSDVLRSQESQSLIYTDPVISVYRTFGQLNNINVDSSLSVVTYDQFPDAVARHASETASQMVVIPWSRGATSILDSQQPPTELQPRGTRNPFDGVFYKTATEDQTQSVIYSEYIRNVFVQSPVDVALFVERGGVTGPLSGRYHLFLAFFGGPDDRVALSFLVQLCENPAVSATVVRIVKTDEEDPEASTPTDVKGAGPQTPNLFPPTFHNVCLHFFVTLWCTLLTRDIDRCCNGHSLPPTDYSNAPRIRYSR